MNLRMTISVLLAAWLAGCDSSSTTAGTSSETVTGLQILANSAEAIVSKLGEGKSAAAGRASRASTAPEDWKLLGLDSPEGFEAISLCQPYKEHRYGLLGTGFLNYSREQPTGEDGGVCSIESQRSFVKERFYDQDGFRSYVGWNAVRWDVRFDSFLVNTLTRYDRYRLRFIASYAGIWRLGSGIVLNYDSLKYFDSTIYDPRGPYPYQKEIRRFEQRIRFADNCEVRLEFAEEDTLKAPVICSEAHVGNFVWDRQGNPLVTRLDGDVVVPQSVPRQTFPEDSVGFSLRNPRIDTVEGVPVLSGTMAWRLLPGDTIRAGDSIVIQQWDVSWDKPGWTAIGTGVLDAKGAFSVPMPSGFIEDDLILLVKAPGIEGQVALPISDIRIVPRVSANALILPSLEGIER